MNKIANIDKVVVPLKAIQKMMAFFRERGDQGLEAVALWAGIAVLKVFHVQEAIIPNQIGTRSQNGLLYTVDAEELHNINVWLYRNKMTLVAQVHTHPGEAYHSETDDAFPIVAAIGGISIVIPDFAADDFNLTDCAVYRLNSAIEWQYLSLDEASTLINII